MLQQCYMQGVLQFKYCLVSQFCWLCLFDYPVAVSSISTPQFAQWETTKQPAGAVKANKATLVPATRWSSKRPGYWTVPVQGCNQRTKLLLALGPICNNCPSAPPRVSWRSFQQQTSIRSWAESEMIKLFTSVKMHQLDQMSASHNSYVCWLLSGDQAALGLLM